MLVVFREEEKTRTAWFLLKIKTQKYAEMRLYSGAWWIYFKVVFSTPTETPTSPNIAGRDLEVSHRSRLGELGRGQ